MTHRPRLKVAVLESPLLPVEAIVLHVLSHHLVVGVEQHVTGCARSGVLHVVHWRRGYRITRDKNTVTVEDYKAGASRFCRSYVYSRRTGGSDTWWRQTSPRRSRQRWASGSSRRRPYTSARPCRGLRGGEKVRKTHLWCFSSDPRRADAVRFSPASVG